MCGFRVAVQVARESRRLLSRVYSKLRKRALSCTHHPRSHATRLSSPSAVDADVARGNLPTRPSRPGGCGIGKSSGPRAWDIGQRSTQMHLGESAREPVSEPLMDRVRYAHHGRMTGMT